MQKLHFVIWACTHVHRWFCVHPHVGFSYWNTLKRVLYGQFLQVEVLNESNLASLCTKHVFKEKEKKNAKQESQDLWKQKNAWLQG